MKALRFLLSLAGLGLVFVFGFGYGRWYSTRPAAKTERKILYYVDPMHSWYKSDKPGVAPDCGMKLVPVFADGGSENPAPNGSGDSNSNAGSVDARQENTLQVNDQKQQLIGVRFGHVELADASHVIRAAGKVAPDETTLIRVQARTDGWIAKVFADYIGKQIENGQPLLTLYSPGILAAEQEYLLALKAKTVMQHSSMGETTVNNEALADAARRRLVLLGLSPAEISEVEGTQKPLQNITLSAPAGGYVIARNAYPGQRVTPETELYTIADLSSVWVMADVFEEDAGGIHPGQSAHVSIPGSAVSYPARVGYIQPQADSALRTVKVRLELTNKDMRLRPDMYVDTRIDSGTSRILSVPSEAVLDSGTTKTVFVDAGNGSFERREVQTGVRSGDRVEIVSGLRAGERIVISGTFLLNSEAQMRQESADEAPGGENHDQPHH